MIKASELIGNSQLPEKGKGLYCLIGQAENGEVHFCDITSAPHILVGGCTGSGKSIFLRGVVLSLIMNYTPDEVGLILLDTKHHAEFVVYDNVPHVLGTDIKQADEELERRLSAKESCATQKKIVVIIDEYVELSFDSKNKKIVEKLAREGAGVGIHVVMVTQRVAKDVITPALQECFQTVVCGVVVDKKTSKFMLGETGAEKLRGYGDMLYKDRGGHIVRVQSGYVGNCGVQEIVERIKVKYA